MSSVQVWSRHPLGVDEEAVSSSRFVFVGASPLSGNSLRLNVDAAFLQPLHFHIRGVISFDDEVDCRPVHHFGGPVLSTAFVGFSQCLVTHGLAVSMSCGPSGRLFLGAASGGAPRSRDILPAPQFPLRPFFGLCELIAWIRWLDALF